MQTENQYRAYLLRLWQVKVQGRLVWRASLEDAQTHVRIGFDGVDALLHYLRQETGGLPAILESDEDEDIQERNEK